MEIIEYRRDDAPEDVPSDRRDVPCLQDHVVVWPWRHWARFGALGLARVPFSKWFRFIWPLTLILLTTVVALAITAQLIGVGPF